MNRVFFILVLFIGFSSCKSTKKAQTNRVIITKKSTSAPTVYNNTNNNKTSSRPSKSNNYSSTAEHIVNYAKQFEGVRYKWGGTTKAGMDCSGLVYESFKSYDIILPRTSKDMAKRGKKIPLNQVTKGDLLFFKTGNRRNSINHVGLIVAIRNNDIEFIHATTSKGVIISNLNTAYWKEAFYEARRIL